MQVPPARSSSVIGKVRPKVPAVDRFGFHIGMALNRKGRGRNYRLPADREWRLYAVVNGNSGRRKQIAERVDRKWVGRGQLSH
jgi:hypothetical protein